jgi:HD-GYP domain-containing protein (c-di-GMP phosphodiesterase class II)
VSQGTLIGIDQLVLGATAACDLADLDGRIVISTGTPITPQLLSRIKEAGIVGLVAGRSDCFSHHLTARRPSIDAIASRILEMQRRSGITNPLTSQTLDYARKTLRDSFQALSDNKLPNLIVLNGLVTRILHDIELIDTAPLPYPRRNCEDIVDRLVDGAIDMAILIAWHLHKAGKDEDTISAAALGGLLHDIGILYVSPSTLKRNTALTTSEFREIKRHPYLGARVLSPFGNDLPSITRDIILLHHEREDGQGYPLKRGGDSIPDITQLAHILDSYVALVSPRPQRDAFPPHKAIEILLRDSGKSFSPTSLRQFVERTGRYPLGCAVVLSTNEVGVVVGQGKGGPFRPVVDVYFSRHHQFSQTARRVDLAHDGLKYVRQVVK